MIGRRYLVFAFLFIGTQAHSGEALDPASAEALAATQAILTIPAKRADALKDPNAAAADGHLKSLGLSTEAQETAYRISSEILEKWVKESGGSGEAIQLKLLELQRNPAALSKELSPASRDSIRKMAEEIPGGATKPN